jgi:hypothetical protein
VNRPVEVLRGAVTAIRDRLSAVAGQSERTIMLGTILLATATSGAMGFVLTHFYSINVFSSLTFLPADCWRDWGMQVGRSCFSDYTAVLGWVMRPNPYQPDLNNYPAAGMVPHLLFGLVGKWLGAPRLGLLGYLLALTIAVVAPAVWATRSARGLERVVVFVALGAVAVPAWTDIGRGNSVGFVVPVGLVFLVALCRQRWALVAVMAVLAALIKPQFAILAVALLVARQWRLGAIAVGGVLISNLAAYLLWPRDFPETIVQSIRATLHYGASFEGFVGGHNVSFAKGLLLIPDNIAAKNAGGTVPDGFLAGPRSLIGYVVLVLMVVAVLALGRRIPPVMVGIALLATAALFPALSNFYYLVFALPVAALVARDPDGPPGSGIFDRLDLVGHRRRAVGICVSVATALSIAQIPLPTPPMEVVIEGAMGVTPIVGTTVGMAPLLWLIVCAAIIVSYARRPAPGASTGTSTTSAAGQPRPAAVTKGNRQ